MAPQGTRSGRGKARPGESVSRRDDPDTVKVKKVHHPALEVDLDAAKRVSQMLVSGIGLGQLAPGKPRFLAGRSGDAERVADPRSEGQRHQEKEEGRDAQRGPGAAHLIQRPLDGVEFSHPGFHLHLA
jgi:hypothetical protein